MLKFRLFHTVEDFHVRRISGRPDGLYDIDGNYYTSVIIGDQEWIVENYRPTRYADGTAIANITEAAAWVADTSGAWCYFDNDEDNLIDHGRLYNEYALLNAAGFVYMERNGVHEADWRIPSFVDIETLAATLGGQPIAGGKMKVPGTTYWIAPNIGATNSSGFTLLGSGHRSSYTGEFLEWGMSGNLWISDGAYSWFVETYSSWLYSNIQGSAAGLSVRLVRDVT